MGKPKTELAPYQARKTAKLCVRGCGRPPSEGKTRCRWCKAKQRAYFAGYRKAKRLTASI